MYALFLIFSSNPAVLSGRCWPEWPQVEFIQVSSLYTFCCVHHLQVPLLQCPEGLLIMVIPSVKCNRESPTSCQTHQCLSGLPSSLLVELRPTRQADFDETIKEFSAKLSLVPLPPPGQLHVVRKPRHVSSLAKSTSRVLDSTAVLTGCVFPSLSLSASAPSRWFSHRERTRTGPSWTSTCICLSSSSATRRCCR